VLGHAVTVDWVTMLHLLGSSTLLVLGVMLLAVGSVVSGVVGVTVGGAWLAWTSQRS
jgi:hypothetical protein